MLVTTEERKRLFKRFLRLDQDQNGVLDTEEIMKLPKAAENPLTRRILQVFDTDKDNAIDFDEFLHGMSVFATSGCTEEKLRFLFQIYDVNQDGFISNGDLYHSLKIMVGDNLEDASLQQVVDKSMRECDKDGDGKLSFDEFKTFIEKNNHQLLEKISIEEDL